MRFALIETRGKKFAVNKDQAGSFGTSTDAGTSLFSRLLNKVKRNGVRTPVMSMAYMHSILKQEGHHVEFFEKKPNDEFDIIIIASSIVDFKNELELAREIKKTSNAKIGFTGAFAQVKPDIFLKVGDFILTGEPEEATYRLAKGEIEPSGIIVSKLISDLDSLPFPEWHNRNLDQYNYYPLLKNKPLISVQGSRGCSYDCTYCPYMVTQTPDWRKRSPKNIVDEIEFLINEFGIKSIVFRDPLFTHDMKRIKNLCTEITERKLNFEWTCETRVDRLDEPLLDMMYDAGLRGVEFGVEAFDLKLLSSMHRTPPTHELQEKIVNYCENIGVKMMAFYVLGIPGQTKDDILQTIDYSKHLNTSLAQFTIATPYPGTKFIEEIKSSINDNGTFENYSSYQPLINSEHYTSEELLKLKEKAFKEYYMRWKWIFKRGLKTIN